MIERKRGGFVTPGSRLGVSEEFVAGPGTYLRDEVIYSNIVGYVLFNILEKRVSVYPPVHAQSIPKRGRVVIGKVSSVQDKFAIVDILRVGRSETGGNFTGILPLAFVGQRISRMVDAFKPGDIIRCKVVRDKDGTGLGTAGNRFGVILGLSTCCGKVLQLRGRRLTCPECGREERRKGAIDYGRVTV